MHVATHEIKRWAWQTFWWSANAGQPYLPSSGAIAAARPMKYLDAAAQQTPLRRLSLPVQLGRGMLKFVSGSHLLGMELGMLEKLARGVLAVPRLESAPRRRPRSHRTRQRPFTSLTARLLRFTGVSTRPVNSRASVTTTSLPSPIRRAASKWPQRQRHRASALRSTSRTS